VRAAPWAPGERLRARPWHLCWAALAFLTVWRTAARRVPDNDPDVWGRAVVCYPAVGLLLGAVQAAAWWGLEQARVPWPQVFVVALGVVLTGALHMDGVMDAADGLFGGTTPAERLRIMRDERVGAFGVLAGVFAVLFKVALLTPRGVWLAPMLGRWAAAWAVVRYPYARAQGLGRGLKDAAQTRHLLGASASVALVLAAWGHPSGWWAWGGVMLGTVGFARWVQRRVPGFTGDLYGALVETAEMLALAVVAVGG